MCIFARCAYICLLCGGGAENRVYQCNLIFSGRGCKQPGVEARLSRAARKYRIYTALTVASCRLIPPAAPHIDPARISLAGSRAGYELKGWPRRLAADGCRTDPTHVGARGLPARQGAHRVHSLLNLNSVQTINPPPLSPTPLYLYATLIDGKCKTWNTTRARSRWTKLSFTLLSKLKSGSRVASRVAQIEDGFCLSN